MRLLIDRQDAFLAESREVLRAGLETTSWITVDDTCARHADRNGFCTQIGNDAFTWFGTRASKNRLSFLDLLRAAHIDYVVNTAALDYMRAHSLASPVISLLAAAPHRHFADYASWLAHLRQLGIVGQAELLELAHLVRCRGHPACPFARSSAPATPLGGVPFGC